MFGRLHNFIKRMPSIDFIRECVKCEHIALRAQNLPICCGEPTLEGFPIRLGQLLSSVSSTIATAKKLTKKSDVTIA